MGGDLPAEPAPGGARRAARRSEVVRRPRVVVALVVLVLVGVFIVQNRDRVDIELFTVTVDAPLWLLLAVVLALGVLVGTLLRRR